MKATVVTVVPTALGAAAAGVEPFKTNRYKRKFNRPSAVLAA